jgi:hypothetical protein
VAYLSNELAHLECIRAKDKKDDLRAAITNHGEVLGGIWSAIVKFSCENTMMLDVSFEVSVKMQS